MTFTQFWLSLVLVYMIVMIITFTYIDKLDRQADRIALKITQLERQCK